MGSAITPEAMACYRESARAREAISRQAAELRRLAAWAAARRAAELLRLDFGATRVIAFGSLAHGAWFHARSDIDLAVEGIAPESFWRAGSALDHLEPAFEIDLIALEAVPAGLAQDIAQGMDL